MLVNRLYNSIFKISNSCRQTDVPNIYILFPIMKDTLSAKIINAVKNQRKNQEKGCTYCFRDQI